MLLTKVVKVKWYWKTKEHYINKGYKFTVYGDKFEVKIEDLTKGYGGKIEVQCEDCNLIKPLNWMDYIKYVREDGKYYCNKCANKLFASKKSNKTKLAKGKSFEQWCIENNRRDILWRFDEQLNNCKPSNIGYASHKKCWFKCPEGLHESELKLISNFTSGNNDIKCKACNSFVSMNCRCNCCKPKSGRIHSLDSLASKYPKILEIWSDKNKKSPYEYAPNGSQKVWWKCLDEKHEDYFRSIDESNRLDFRCPKCSFSKGEKKVEEYLISNKIQFEPQKKYNGLVGLKNGNLSYDFYLYEYNLLIEYQGEYHDGTVRNQIKEDLEKQQEHDRRKREYATVNKIKLLEIWYWDYNNIEEILNKALNHM